jgi:hypothetical protein
MKDVNEFALLMQKQLNNYYVNAHGCWIHRNKPNAFGYIPLGYKRRKEGIQEVFLAHRLSYALHVGFVPKDMNVLHTCDVPPCINPEHLFLGTHTDNMKDMAAKERTHLQLSEDEVSFIFTLRDMGYSQNKIARLIGVAQTTVSRNLRKEIS